MGFFDFVKNKWHVIKGKYVAHKAMKKREKSLKDEYRDLAPIDKLPNGKEYLSALHWAIKNKRVKNIALTGPYGSGKSSIVNAYLKRHPIVKFTHLRVSMATFVENVIDENGDKKKISFSPDQIEEGILKQLFYKVNHHKIPQSRYRKLHKVSYWSILGILLGIVSLLALGTFVFFPEQLNSVIGMITDAGMKVGLSEKYSLVIAGVFLFVMVLVLAYIWRQIQSRFKLKEIKVRDTTVKSEACDKESIFNKNMDEIIYFFEETRYRVVFFRGSG